MRTAVCCGCGSAPPAMVTTAALLYAWLQLPAVSGSGVVTISNVVPRRDTTGAIINAHAGGLYNFSGRFYLLGEHYRSCPHAGGNKTRDSLAVGNCEMCGHTGTTFALYTSLDLQSWTMVTANVIPDKPGGAGANLYTPVMVYNAKLRYYILLFQCSGGCSDGQLQVATAPTPRGPFVPRGAVLPFSAGHGTSSQGGIWVDPATQIGYLIFNSIGNGQANGQWIVELDETFLHLTNRSANIVAAGPGSEGGWLEGGGIFKRSGLYYYMAGSGCCYCAGGGGAMVFVAPHPLGPWRFQTNVNDGLYLPFSPMGTPPPPPPLPPGPAPPPSESCADLSGEWASSVLDQNYQPLRAGLTVRKIAPQPPPPPQPPTPRPRPSGPAVTISTGSGTQRRCLADMNSGERVPDWQQQQAPFRVSAPRHSGSDSGSRNNLVTLVACAPVAAAAPAAAAAAAAAAFTVSTTEQQQRLWQPADTGTPAGSSRYVNFATGRCLDAAYGAPGRALYTNDCTARPGVGQTWEVLGGASSKSESEMIMNVAAKTCISASTNTTTVEMEVCAGQATGEAEDKDKERGPQPLPLKQRWLQNWTLSQPPTAPPAPAPPTPILDWYNLTSTTETHWPAVPRGGLLLAVDPGTQTVHISGAGGASGAGHTSALRPWRNPHANDNEMAAATTSTSASSSAMITVTTASAAPSAPDCTMIPAFLAGALACKLPYCGESVRPVAAQQFNVLSLGGEVLYYGERWQSTPSGLKSEDFSYLEILRFDEKGVVQRLNFTDSFVLPL
jgi:hypothetical protein